MAERVIGAAGTSPVAVVCDDRDVAGWARSLGALVIWEPGRGLNGAVEDGVAHLAGLGVEHVTVAHADLPLATDLSWVSRFPGVTLVPDRRDDGTNVIGVPTAQRVRLLVRSRFLRPPCGRGPPAWATTADRPFDPAGVGRRSARRSRRGAPTGLTDQAHESPMEPSTNLPTPGAALAIGAHPDDVEFGCGATLAKWAAAGCRIHHLVCTDGSKGSWDPDEDTAQLVATRQEEQRAASRALGGDGAVTFLGWPDGELEAGLRQRWEVAYWIRAVKPDVVLGHDPWRRYRLHPDHRHAGFLATDGIVAARDPHFFPEQGAAPHRPQALLLWEADEADHVEDVDGFVEREGIGAARPSQPVPLDDAHRRPRWRRPTSNGSAARSRTRLAEHGRQANLAVGEAFKLMTNL